MAGLLRWAWKNDWRGGIYLVGFILVLTPPLVLSDILEGNYRRATNNAAVSLLVLMLTYWHIRCRRAENKGGVSR